MMKKILTLLLLISLLSSHPAHAIGGISGRPVTINPLAATTLFLCLNDNIGTGDDQQCSGTQLESLLWGDSALTGTTTVSSIRYNSGGGFGGSTASGAPMYGLVYSNTSSAYQAWLAAVNGTTPVVTLAPPTDGQLNIAATTFTSGLWQMTNLAAIRPYDTVSGHSYLMGVYDNTASSYKAFLTATNGASPTVVLSTPTDGILNIVATSIYEGLNHVATLANTLGDFASTTSAQLAAKISDATGTGQLVFNSGATLTAPTIGALNFQNTGGFRTGDTTTGHTYIGQVYDNTGSAYRNWLAVANGASPTVLIAAPTNGTLTVNKYTFTAPATAATLTIANNKTLTASNTLTFTGTDSSSVAFGAGGTVLYNGGALGTPSSGTATNLSGTASALTAGNVTTNANLTGPVTSVGNATTISANAVSLSMLATQATNTILGNATSGSAVPTALSVGSCSTAGSALIWTTNSGFSCNTSITAASTTGNAGTATALATGRTIAITGDLAYTSPSFDGSGNVTAAGTLATVNNNIGSFGSSTAIPNFTVNEKGLITAAGTNAVVAPAGTLTGNALPSGLLYSSVKGVGTLTSGATGAGFTVALGTSTITGTLPATNLPNPSSSTLGGVQSIASVSHNFLTSISTSGVPSQAQPACGDLSNAAASCSTDTTTFSNITTGNISTTGTAATASHAITSASASSLAVGRQGTTNPVLAVDSSVASQIDGIAIQGGAVGGGTTITATSSGSNSPLTLNALGTGNLNLNAGATAGLINMQVGGSTYAVFGQSRVTMAPTTSSVASTKRFSFTAAADTSLTSGAEATEAQFDMSVVRQHALNTSIALQRWFRFIPGTDSFVGGVGTGTITDDATVSIDGGPIGGTNAKITNSHGLYISSIAFSSVTNGYGMTVNAPSGATNNYVAKLGGILIDSLNEISGFISLVNTTSGTTYTLAASDCGTTRRFTSGSAITVTTLNSLQVGCTTEIIQEGAGQITIANGSGATQENAHSQTKTFGQYSAIRLKVVTNAGGTAAVFNVAGDTGT